MKSWNVQLVVLLCQQKRWRESQSSTLLLYKELSLINSNINHYTSDQEQITEVWKKSKKASPGEKGRKLAVCFGYNCDFNHCRLAKVLAIIFNLLKHFTTYIFTNPIKIFFKFDKFFSSKFYLLKTREVAQWLIIPIFLQITQVKCPASLSTS